MLTSLGRACGFVIWVFGTSFSMDCFSGSAGFCAAGFDFAFTATAFGFAVFSREGTGFLTAFALAAELVFFIGALAFLAFDLMVFLTDLLATVDFLVDLVLLARLGADFFLVAM
ncbi:hypothetical protein [Candidiatus Paracoxiella cheracis]|uniref:hypothetical protein n=1 Tax=Candidiatus Paracoxiella cheracis TaxID=3405120 RepID=UPI003BF52DE9